ncbi:MAG: proteasome accessory factor PafA2 family protein [Candidatus Poribacteria bacterium]|nr:proteasome accessory factor PafA2 family protein [Candidatus Poribacteria bacterium]MDE0505980.1 proteasome accessory factor PafA2 family protein [Candidatus Poribacteria bacterium]
MDRRIYGLENEYGIICTPERRGGKALSIQNAVMYLFREIISGRMYPDVFLENGARFYQDIGCHPEYATPECDNVIELLTHDKAGERIIERLSTTAEKKMRFDGFFGKISVFKNNTDTPGNTYGCHENYLMDRRVSFRQLASQLIPFFVTRQVFTGAGKAIRTDRGKYVISQRAQHIREEISIATTTARGIINTRDEPHADREKYRRLHVIVGDSNMSEFATFLKVGTTAIVLRMIEDNFIRQRLALRNSVKAIQEISTDTTCSRNIELENGKRLTAVELQWQYFECAKHYFEQAESDSITDQVMERWEYTLKCLEVNPLLLDRELDWVIKKKLIETYVASRNLKWDSNDVLMLDLQYHNIRREGETKKTGLYYKLEQKDQVERMVTDEQVDKAMHLPPETTRAKFRGRFVKLANERKILCGVNWSYIQLYEPYQKLFLSTDPLKSEYEEASRMIYSI